MRGDFVLWKQRDRKPRAFDKVEDSESVADHSYGLIMLAMLLADKLGVDSDAGSHVILNRKGVRFLHFAPPCESWLRSK